MVLVESIHGTLRGQGKKTKDSQPLQCHNSLRLKRRISVSLILCINHPVVCASHLQISVVAHPKISQCENKHLKIRKGQAINYDPQVVSGEELLR